MTTLYDNTPEGLSGNEDCGQMSAWYVFSAMGMYPVNPAEGIYVFGKPLFDRLAVMLANGKQFEIEAQDLSHENIYIQSVALNGVPHPQLYITHEQLMQGGKLVFVMGPKPNSSWGTTEDSRPPSMSGSE